jgi:hypothetical protein
MEVPVRTEDYWRAAQTELATAITLVQQGTEFFLKSRIAEVSPFLLINGNPKDWPKEGLTQDVAFADFRAIDAQDLIRAHDMAVTNRFPLHLKENFEELRRLRNKIIHTVDKRLSIEVERVVNSILEISDWFIGPKLWVQVRREHLQSTPRAIAYILAEDIAVDILAGELMQVVDLLKPVDVKRLLGFDTKPRRYICNECAMNSGEVNAPPRLACLKPNTPSSTNIHCLVCGKDYKVIRESCNKPPCRGNVIDVENPVCLTCFKYQ